LASAKLNMEGKRTKPTVADAIKLFRRGELDLKAFIKWTEANGVIKDEDRQLLLKAADAWPSLSDSLRYMMRDVSDEQNVDWSKADAEFEKKYRGRVKKYFDAIGVPREIALDAWRAHFHIPSFTMLTEMQHRLRPFDVEPGLHVTEKMVRDALIQDDWHPDWVERMMAIAYKPVTRTDSVRAYMIHAIDDLQLKKFFMDFGYDDKSSDFYVGYHKKNREIQDKRRAGFPTLRSLVQQYARCELSDSEFRDIVAQLSLSQEQERNSVEAARVSSKVRQRQRLIGSVRKPFVKGLIDEGEAQALLSNGEIDPQCVSNLMQIWQLDRLSQSKFDTATQLCKMREYGIISPGDQVRALIRIGFDREAAVRIVELCGAQLSDKQQRRAEAEARRAASEQRRIIAEAKKRQRELECGPPACPKNTPGGQAGTSPPPANPGRPSGSGGTTTR
jgi:hypothetical protein